MSKTSIEWTQRVWNPIVGCSIVSPGCTNCYAMKMAARLEAIQLAEHELGKRPILGPYCGTTKKVNGNAVWTGEINRASNETLLQPLKRRKPTTYFVNSMSDLFHEDVPDEWIDQVFAVMALCPQHIFQVLTKRAARMRDYVCKRGGDWMVVLPDAHPAGHLPITKHEVIARIGDTTPEHRALYRAQATQWPLPNVQLGVSIERQKEADERIPLLLQTPAAVRFISAEPLLGPLDVQLWMLTYPSLDWVIVGGESGPGARPMHPVWARSLRDQCAAAGVPFFFKQWGEWEPCDAINVSMKHALCGALGQPPHVERDWLKALGFLQKSTGVTGAAVVRRSGKKRAGRHLDGVLHDAMPERRA
jgi:protein gp37